MNEVNRRKFLKTTAAIGAVSFAELHSNALAAAESVPTCGHGPLIDTNVTLSHWPGRRVSLDDTANLVSALRRKGVTQAWAGSFDALLHKDLGAVNFRLTEECRRHGRGMLVPFGSVNPQVPDWEEELRRCHEDYKMPGIRLFPNYHRYQLDDPKFGKLLGLCVKRSLLVQISVMMEEERMQNPLLKVPHVDVSPLGTVLPAQPNARIVLLNWWRAVKGEQISKAAKAGNVCFDIATLEEVGGIACLLKLVPADRVIFGSYAPLFYFESALLKLKESPLSPDQLEAIRSASAKKLLAG